MSATYFYCEQLSDEWWALRRGVPTASEFSRIMTPAKRQLSSSADGYIAQLIGEMFDAGYPRLDGPTNGPMRHGVKLEPESRRYYEFENGVKVKPVGFIKSACGRFGASPDATVCDDGLLELKNPTAKTHMEWLLGGTLPDEYKCQVHGQLIVTGRKWVDFMSYMPGSPKQFCVRVFEDDFTKDLRVNLQLFWDRFSKALSRVTA